MSWTAGPRARALAAFCAFAAGIGAAIVCAGVIASVPPAVWCAAALVPLALAMATRGWWCRGGLLGAIVLLGVARVAGGLLWVPGDHLAVELAGTASRSPVDMIVRGVLLESPRVERGTEGRGALARFFPAGVTTSLRLRVEQVADRWGEARAVWRERRGVVWVRVDGDLTSAAGRGVRAGDRLEAVGAVSAVRAPSNPGESDARLWALDRAYAGSLWARSVDDVRSLEAGGSREWALDRAWLMFRDTLQRRAARAMDVALPVDSADTPASAERSALVRSLLLGDAEVRDGQITAAFQRLGLSHVLSISGFHLTIMAMVALALVRLIGDRGALEPLLVGVCVIVYTLMVPAQTPIVRSAALTLALLGAEALGRRYDRTTILLWIGVALLVWRPSDLFSLGFQLSLGLTLLLLWMGEHVRSAIFPRPLRGQMVMSPGRWFLLRTAAKGVVDRLKDMLAAGILCWAVASPWIAWRIGLVSPMAVLSGMVMIPLVMALMIVGYIALLVGMLWPEAGLVLVPVLRVAADGVGWMALTLDALPGASIRSPVVGGLWTIAAMGLAMVWLARARLRVQWAWVLALALLGWLAVEIAARGRLAGDVRVRLDVLAVGRGSCQLLRSGDDAVLWDCGSWRGDLGVRRVPMAVRALGQWRVPTIVLSGADLVVMSGVLDVLEPLGVRRVYVPPALREREKVSPQGPAVALRRELLARGIEVVDVAAEGVELALGTVRLRLLPTSDGSLVGLVVDDRDSSKGGDAGGVGDVGVMALAGGGVEGLAVPRAEVVVLPRDGAGSVRVDAVRAINPRVMILAAGEGQTRDVSWRWEEVATGRVLWRTAWDGAAWVEYTAQSTLRVGGVR